MNFLILGGFFFFSGGFSSCDAWELQSSHKQNFGTKPVFGLSVKAQLCVSFITKRGNWDDCVASARPGDATREGPSSLQMCKVKRWFWVSNMKSIMQDLLPKLQKTTPHGPH